MAKTQVIFTGHGSPMNAIGTNRANTGWQYIGSHIEAPKVIIAVSAHWATRGTRVRTAATNPQINDMYGFPKELYEVHYEPAGSPEYAARVLELLGNAAAEDNTFGIDHGVWSVLSNMFPEANIPVVMVSTDVTASPEELYEIGRKLQPLREEGAMIIASGNVVHNLRMVDWENQDGADWADAFDETIRDLIQAKDHEAVLHFRNLKYAEYAVPTDEHFQPLFVAMGATDEADRVAVWNEYRELGSMSMTSYMWG